MIHWKTTDERLQRINNSMIKIMLRMCARDEDRRIFHACNLTPLSQKLGSELLQMVALISVALSFNTAQT